jgi:hypothetical protein
MFDPSDLSDIRRASEHLAHLADLLLNAPAGLRRAVEEILGLGCGELLRLAYQHFGSDRFTLVTLAARADREVASLHSLAANLGRACAQRSVEVFERHGGQPMEMSIREEVVGALLQINN